MLTFLINRYPIDKKVQFVATVCKYWSLKRQERKGAPLLRRLHIQSFSSTASVVGNLSYEELNHKFDLLLDIRDNLEKAKEILDQICKREALKVFSFFHLEPQIEIEFWVLVFGFLLFAFSLFRFFTFSLFAFQFVFISPSLLLWFAFLFLLFFFLCVLSYAFQSFYIPNWKPT